MSDSKALEVEQFPVEYRENMIIAYPVIARMSRNEFYYASSSDRDEAFARVLAAKNDPAEDAALRTLVAMTGEKWNRGEALERAAEAVAP